MIIWVVIALSLLQGCTEVLPISSSGHLAVFTRVIGLADVNLGVVAVLHSGSFLAILYWFRRDVTHLWRSLRASWSPVRGWLLNRNPNPLAHPGDLRVPYYLAASLVPLAIEGYLLRGLANEAFLNPGLVAGLLVMNGLIILITARWSRGERTLSELPLRDYLLIGAIQALAVLPGISRLGLTLCAGLWRRLNWREAVRLTFVLALPAIVGGILVQAGEISAALDRLNVSPFDLAIGLGVVALASTFGLKVLTSSLLERRTLLFFGYYCLMVGMFAGIYIVARA